MEVQEVQGGDPALAKPSLCVHIEIRDERGEKIVRKQFGVVDPRKETSWSEALRAVHDRAQKEIREQA